MFVITALRQGTRMHVLLTREGVVLVDPADACRRATEFERPQDAEEGVQLLRRMRDAQEHSRLPELEGLEGAELSVLGTRRKAAAGPMVIAILTPYGAAAEQRPADYVRLWDGGKPKRVRYGKDATRFANMGSADNALGFVQRRFGLAGRRETMESREYVQVRAADAAAEAEGWKAYVKRMETGGRQ